MVGPTNLFLFLQIHLLALLSPIWFNSSTLLANNCTCSMYIYVIYCLFQNISESNTLLFHNCEIFNTTDTHMTKKPKHKWLAIYYLVNAISYHQTFLKYEAKGNGQTECREGGCLIEVNHSGKYSLGKRGLVQDSILLCSGCFCAWYAGLSYQLSLMSERWRSAV